MNTRKILIILVAIVVTLGVIIGLEYLVYNNKEVGLRKQVEAQRGKVEANYDAMWKIISQQAQVSDKYREAFREIYPDLISGRYSQGDGSLMKWIQEQNPEFSPELYKTLMETIEVQRISFTKDQARMLDLIREHETLINTYPGVWFISNKTPIEYTVISSTRSKTTMETGIDDDINLF